MSEEQNQTVVETIKGNIKILRFNQPNRKNAANMNAYIKIRQALKEAAENCDISMVILTGTGDFYCSGNDLKDRRDKGPELTNELLDRIKEMVEEFVLFPKPLVAIVNGPAVGVAVTTLALCDFVFAAEHAYFYAPFTKLGVVPEACSTYTFPKLIGYRKALELLLLNQRISSKEALSCGLVNNVWGMEELEERAWEKIEEINNIPTDTFVKAKKLFRQPILKQLLVANNAEMDTLRTFVGLKSRLSSSLSSITDLFRPSNPTGLRSRDLSSTRLSALKKEIQTDAHLIPLKDLYTNLETDPVNGLRKEQAHRRLAYDGPNTLTPATQYGWPLLLFKSLCTGFSTLIWLGAILCLAAYVIERATKLDPGTDNLYLGCVLITVDVICGLFSFFQNYQSCKIMKSFKSMIPMHARCTRDGVLDTEMPVRDLVKGDIVEVRAGDVIPADIRIIDSKGFKVDNSSLTGESVAVSRSNVEGTENILDSPNVAFFSALCVEGYAKGVVLCCGDLTALGRVAGLAARLQPKPSPLAQELHRFMRYVSVWALILGFVVTTACFALGYPFMQTIIFVIGMIVANIPEGLQPTVTASLTLTAKRMVSKNCLVKNLESIEALGACTTICSDKTGTLTENKMCVRHIWMWNREFMMGTDADDSMYQYKAFEHLKICAALCSSATVENETIRGDASEKAILNFLLQFNDPIGIRRNFPKVAEIPFNSVNKYQMSIHSDSQSKYLLVIKGAPECILAKCSTIIAENEEVIITKEIAAVIDKVTENLASTGERILAFADLQLDVTQFDSNFDFDMDDANFPLKDLRFLGLMGLIDPPRKEVRSAIEHVRSAGVRVMMVTGDHPATARAIAADVSIATQRDCRVVTGAELRRMTPDLLTKTLEKHYEIVFARTSPTQKLQIVEACQKLGGVVAVTGDGVNDAPALKCADIGISMGITGSQVSQHTADIILIDDNFATIVVGIEEGRKIFDNLKKSICYILISNVPEIFPVLMFVLFSIPLPLGVMTILCVDLGTDMWPAVALSFEQAESDVMSRPPRAGPLVSPRMLALTYGHLGLMEFAAGMFAYFIVMAEFGFYPRDLFGIRKQWDCEAVNDLPDSLGQEWTYWERKEVERAGQAAYFAAVVVTQMTNGVICKTRYNSIFHVGMRNMVLNMGLVFELLLACFVCYTPGLNTFLRTYPLPLKWWFLALPYSALMFAFDELRKYCIRKRLFRGWYNNITLY